MENFEKERVLQEKERVLQEKERVLQVTAQGEKSFAKISKNIHSFSLILFTNFPKVKLENAPLHNAHT